MRRVMLAAVSVLIVMSMAVSPALATDRDRDCWDEDSHFWVCDGNRHDGDRHDRDRHHNDVEVCFVPVLVPFGFWEFDWFWGWYWIDWGSYWRCLD